LKFPAKGKGSLITTVSLLTIGNWWIFVAGGLLVFIITALTVSWQSYKAASANPADSIKG
jgi:hypothetical protein